MQNYGLKHHSFHLLLMLDKITGVISIPVKITGVLIKITGVLLKFTGVLLMSVKITGVRQVKVCHSISGVLICVLLYVLHISHARSSTAVNSTTIASVSLQYFLIHVI